MKFHQTSAVALSALALAACATVETTPEQTFEISEADQAAVNAKKYEILGISPETANDFELSDAALATAVRGPGGAPVGPLAYASPGDAVKAGDMAAFVAAMKLSIERNDSNVPFASAISSIDAAAAEDYERARDLADVAAESAELALLGGFLKAWYLALEGDFDAAVDAELEVGSRLPGLTGDLSLAAMLEAAGREEEALAVYSAITPSEIEAPEHQFDPQSIIFSHVRLVISRQALLLRRLGRVEEAVELYQRLAEAEPERAATYAAAIEQIETGRGLDDEALDVDTAFARTMADYSLALAYQRMIRSAFAGQQASGFDDTKAAFDQLALLIDPDNEDLRLAVIADLYDETLFESALHVAEVAPEETASLQLAKAQSYVRMEQADEARTALDRALELADEDEKLSTTSSAMLIYALLGEQESASELAETTPDLAETDAEKASAHSTSATIYSQFGNFERALFHAEAARELDDTHERRMALANAMADAGQVDEALQLIRAEALRRPNDPYMLNTLGYFLIENTDQYSEAYRVLARANALAPNDPYIADSYGWARYRLGDLEGAARYIELARRLLEPNTHWEIEDHLGDIYWHLGREDEARAAWERALTDYPREETRQNLARKLENGLEGPPPEKQPLPDISLGDDQEVNRQDI
ncbi:tetratricopeptide repeat protein [Henriciella algicola]|uniref:Tetratricopeptide repeat protein n=1 Tax=Henriciella algicola TaxID=1608422 RepID=A0A399RH64_9PROT|nr:hypothetical protein [Henriciella algicola]RIJ30946.1 hypothetical protein D1222_01360 [Henriciella algicola]